MRLSNFYFLVLTYAILVAGGCEADDGIDAVDDVSRTSYSSDFVGSWVPIFGTVSLNGLNVNISEEDCSFTEFTFNPLDKFNSNWDFPKIDDDTGDVFVKPFLWSGQEGLFELRVYNGYYVDFVSSNNSCGLDDAYTNFFGQFLNANRTDNPRYENSYVNTTDDRGRNVSCEFRLYISGEYDEHRYFFDASEFSNSDCAIVEDIDHECVANLIKNGTPLKSVSFDGGSRSYNFLRPVAKGNGEYEFNIISRYLERSINGETLLDTLTFRCRRTSPSVTATVRPFSLSTVSPSGSESFEGFDHPDAMDCVVGNCAVFDGSFSKNWNSRFGAAGEVPLTVNFWIHLLDASEKQVVVSKYSSALGPYIVAASPEYIHFYMNSPSGSIERVDFQLPISLVAKWSMITIIHSSPTSIKLYFNGAFIAEGVVNNTTYDLPSEILYGELDVDRAEYFDGLIPLRGVLDEHTIYDYEISPLRISMLYSYYTQ